MHSLAALRRCLPAFLAAVLGAASPRAVAGPVEVESNVTIDGKVYKYAQGWWDSGKKHKWYEHYWRQNEKQLTHKTWNETGGLQSEETYRDGYLHGPFRSYHPNGKLALAATYVKGAYQGVVKAYDESGSLHDEAGYAVGIRDGAWTRYFPAAPGSKPVAKFTGNFARGQPIGAFRELSPAGQIVREIAFTAGKAATPSSKAPGTKPPREVALRFATGGHEGWDFNVLVHADGSATFATMELVGRVATAKQKDSGLAPGTFYYDAVDRLASFQMKPEHQSALAATMRELRLLDLKDRYVDDDVDDGSQWHVTFVLDGKAKDIYCSNDFPEALKSLRTYLEDRLLPGYELELEAAQTLPSHTVSREISAP